MHGAAVRGAGPRQGRNRRRRPRAGSAGHRRAHRAPGRRHPPDLRGEEGEGAPRRRTAAGRHQAGQGLRRHEAQAAGRRQDGRPARQQGRHRPGAAGRGHAVPAGRHAGGDRAEPAGRAVAHERRADPRDPPRLGGARPRPLLRDAGLRRRDRSRDHRLARQGRARAGRRQDAAARRPDRRPLRAAGHRRLHLHAEALAPGRRQDPRPVDRAVLAHHPAAAGRQGAVRRPALRRDGGVGARGLRRRAHPPGTAHGQVGRRHRPRQDLRVDRQGRRQLHARPARVVQRAHPRAAVALPRRGADFHQAAAGWT